MNFRKRRFFPLAFVGLCGFADLSFFRRPDVTLHLNGVFVTFRGADCQGCAFRAEEGMRKKIKLSLGPGIDVEEIELRDGRWVLSARAAGERSCPVCGHVSTSRHDWHHRRLQDLPVQGTPLVLDLRLGRWRCLNEWCRDSTVNVALSPRLTAPMSLSETLVSTCIDVKSVATRKRVGVWKLAATVWPISTLRLTTVPSTGDTISV